jgi:hypothetical protein
VNNTDPSEFIANGGESTATIMGWGGSVTGIAALSGATWTASKIAGGIGAGALNPVTSALTGQYGMFDGSAGSTQSATAPSAAPRGGWGGREGTAGAAAQIGAVGNSLPSGKGLQEYLRSRGIQDERLAMSTTCMLNPSACAEVAADVVATLIARYLPFIEVVAEAVVASEAVPAAAMAAPLIVPGDSVVVRATPTRPFPGWDGTKPPGPGYKWRGRGAPGSPEG